MNMPAPALLAANDRTNRWMKRLAVLVGVLLLLISATGLVVTVASLNGGSRQRNLLVDCVTPGPKVGAVTGHKCWDRLHDPHATDNAVALIVDDLYCDQRRAQHKLPAVADPTVPCRSQTAPDVYPGEP